jgi:hypothetical protein
MFCDVYMDFTYIEKIKKIRTWKYTKRILDNFNNDVR